MVRPLLGLRVSWLEDDLAFGCDAGGAAGVRKLALAELLDAVNVNFLESLLLDMSKSVVIYQVLLLSAGLGGNRVSLLEEVDAALILSRHGGSCDNDISHINVLLSIQQITIAKKNKKREREHIQTRSHFVTLGKAPLSSPSTSC